MPTSPAAWVGLTTRSHDAPEVHVLRFVGSYDEGGLVRLGMEAQRSMGRAVGPLPGGSMVGLLPPRE